MNFASSPGIVRGADSDALTPAAQLDAQAGIWRSIARMRQLRTPKTMIGPEQGKFPYLGAGFEFLPKPETDAAYLRNIHCFNLAAQLSVGLPVGDVPSVVDHPRLISVIAHDLFVAGVDVAAHKRFSEAPQVPPDPTPYQKAVSKA